MSVQRNQYLIYGHLIEKGDIYKGFYEKHERFFDDSAYKEGVNHVDGIFCLYDGMSGKYAIVGRVLEKSTDGECIADGRPLTMPSFTELEIELIEASIKRNFEIKPQCHYYLVTHYR
jgi:hypothetical protein